MLIKLEIIKQTEQIESIDRETKDDTRAPDCFLYSSTETLAFTPSSACECRHAVDPHVDSTLEPFIGCAIYGRTRVALFGHWIDRLARQYQRLLSYKLRTWTDYFRLTGSKCRVAINIKRTLIECEIDTPTERGARYLIKFSINTGTYY